MINVDDRLFSKCEKLFLRYFIRDNLVTLDDIHNWVYSKYGYDDELDLFLDKLIVSISLSEVIDILRYSNDKNTDEEYCQTEYELGKLAYEHRYALGGDLYCVASYILYGDDSLRNLFSDKEIGYLYAIDDEYIEDEEAISFLKKLIHQHNSMFMQKYKIFH